jgi:hypothetical protein
MCTFFWTPAENNKETLQIKLEVSRNFTVAQTIRMSIEAFNRLIETERKNVKKITVTFSELGKFSLLIAKKNGKKKTDLPCKKCIENDF